MVFVKRMAYFLAVLENLCTKKNCFLDWYMYEQFLDSTKLGSPERSY